MFAGELEPGDKAGDERMSLPAINGRRMCNAPMRCSSASAEGKGENLV